MTDTNPRIFVAGHRGMVGSGDPMREFLNVDDMATATVHVMNLDAGTWQAHTRPT